jgi:hypothetical protein
VGCCCGWARGVRLSGGRPFGRAESGHETHCGPAGPGEAHHLAHTAVSGLVAVNFLSGNDRVRRRGRAAGWGHSPVNLGGRRSVNAAISASSASLPCLSYSSAGPIRCGPGRTPPAPRHRETRNRTARSRRPHRSCVRPGPAAHTADAAHAHAPPRRRCPAGFGEFRDGAAPVGRMGVALDYPDGLTMTKLAEALEMTARRVTALVDPLAEDGLALQGVERR